MYTYLTILSVSSNSNVSYNSNPENTRMKNTITTEHHRYLQHDTKSRTKNQII